MINEESKKNYPTSWEIVKLGDFADSEKGKKPKNQQPLQNEEFHLPYIDIEAFEKGIFKSFTDGEKCVICDDSDFLMVWDGSRSGLVGKGLKGALGSTLVRINLPMINNLYGYYYLQSKYLEINTRAKGVGIPHVDPFLLWNYDFPIPPVNEQNRIVDKIETLFSEVDAGIENLTLAKRQLGQYRQSLLKHAFEGKLTAKWREEYAEKHGKSLPSGDELLEQIQTARQNHYDQQIADWEQAVKGWEEQGKEGRKPSKPKYTQPKKVSEDETQALPHMPESFIYSYLSNTGILARGKSKHRPRNDKILFDGDYPFLQTGEIKAADKYVVNYTRTYNEVGLKQSKLWNAGTLCITIAANIADTAFLTFDACFPDSVVGYEAFSDIINPEYVDFFIQSAKSRIEFYAPATAQKNINLTTLENLLIPFCSIEEQNKVVELLDLNLAQCRTLGRDIENSLKKLAVLKTSILHKAFQGKLVPQDPNDPPASELLAQIKAEREAKALAEKQAKQDKAASKNKSKSAKTPKKSKKDEQITLPL